MSETTTPELGLIESLSFLVKHNSAICNSAKVIAPEELRIALETARIGAFHRLAQQAQPTIQQLDHLEDVCQRLNNSSKSGEGARAEGLSASSTLWSPDPSAGSSNPNMHNAIARTNELKEERQMAEVKIACAQLVMDATTLSSESRSLLCDTETYSVTKSPNSETACGQFASRKYVIAFFDLRAKLTMTSIIGGTDFAAFLGTTVEKLPFSSQFEAVRGHLRKALDKDFRHEKMIQPPCTPLSAFVFAELSDIQESAVSSLFTAEGILSRMYVVCLNHAFTSGQSSGPVVLGNTLSSLSVVRQAFGELKAVGELSKRSLCSSLGGGKRTNSGDLMGPTCDICHSSVDPNCCIHADVLYFYVVALVIIGHSSSLAWETLDMLAEVRSIVLCVEFYQFLLSGDFQDDGAETSQELLHMKRRAGLVVSSAASDISACLAWIMERLTIELEIAAIVTNFYNSSSPVKEYNVLQYITKVFTTLSHGLALWVAWSLGVTSHRLTRSEEDKMNSSTDTHVQSSSFIVAMKTSFNPTNNKYLVGPHIDASSLLTIAYTLDFYAGAYLKVISNACEDPESSAQACHLGIIQVCIKRHRMVMEILKDMLHHNAMSMEKSSSESLCTPGLKVPECVIGLAAFLKSSVITFDRLLAQIKSDDREAIIDQLFNNNTVTAHVDLENVERFSLKWNLLKIEEFSEILDWALNPILNVCRIVSSRLAPDRATPFLLNCFSVLLIGVSSHPEFQKFFRHPKLITELLSEQVDAFVTKETQTLDRKLGVSELVHGIKGTGQCSPVQWSADLRMRAVSVIRRIVTFFSPSPPEDFGSLSRIAVSAIRHECRKKILENLVDSYSTVSELCSELEYPDQTDQSAESLRALIV